MLSSQHIIIWPCIILYGCGIGVYISAIIKAILIKPSSVRKLSYDRLICATVGNLCEFVHFLLILDLDRNSWALCSRIHQVLLSLHFVFRKIYILEIILLVDASIHIVIIFVDINIFPSGISLSIDSRKSLFILNLKDLSGLSICWMHLPWKGKIKLWFDWVLSIHVIIWGNLSSSSLLDCRIAEYWILAFNLSTGSLWWNSLFIDFGIFMELCWIGDVYTPYRISIHWYIFTLIVHW